MANVKGIAQFTITDYNDITVSTTAPTNPVKDQMWLDTSSDPSILKRYNGSSWDVVNETIVGGRNRALGTATAKTATGFTGIVNYCPSMYTVLTSGLVANNSVTVSFNFSYTGLTYTTGAAKRLVIQGNGDVTNWGPAWTSKDFTNSVDWAAGSGSVKFKYTFIISAPQMTNSKFTLNIRTDYITGGSFTVSDFKVECGNITTDWTPAPEDVDASIATVKTVTESNTTSINTIQGQISTLISNTTITKTDGTTTQLKDAYNGTVNTINSMKTTIAEHTTDINANTNSIASVTSKAATLDANLNSISMSLSSTQSTVSTHTSQIATANSNIATINTTVTNTVSRVSSLELTADSLTTRVGNTETAISSLSIGGRNYYKKASFNGQNVQNATYDNLTNEWTLTVNSGVASWRGLKYNSQNAIVRANETVTISFEVYSDSLISLYADINNYLVGTTTGSNDNDNTSKRVYPTTDFVTGKWQKKYFQYTMGNVSSDYYDNSVICLSNSLNLSNAITFKLRNIKFEKGNQATDWTPAPEDVDSSINSNVTTINQTTDSIKASVSSLQSSVSTIQTTLVNKADTTTVTSVTNRVSTLESSVTGINASITTLNSNVSSVTTTANSAKSAIDNLQVGGRNLLIGTSKDIKSIILSGWGDWTATGTNSAKLSIEKGQTYTARIYLKTSTQNARILCRGFKDITGSQYYDYWGNIIDANSEGYSSVTFTTQQDVINLSVFAIRFSSSSTPSNTVQYKELKLEKGNKATDWTPAPEDVDSQITTINSNVSSLQSSVSILQNQISLKVEQTTFNSTVSTINGQIATQSSSISSLQSQINVQAGQISSKVERSTFNSYMSNVNLIQNGDFSYGVIPDSTAAPTHWHFWGAAKVWSGQGQSGYSNARTLYIAHPSTSACGMYSDNLNLEANTQYTISFSFSKEGNISGASNMLEYYDSSGNAVKYENFPYDTSKSGTIQSFTFTTPSSFSRVIFGSNATSTSAGGGFLTALGNVKLEKGSVATGWDLTNNIGTIITQSATQVMTAFNNISNYFQVSPDGAKFGDFSSGAYTKMSQKGLEHVDSTGATPYHYITYLGHVMVDMSGTTEKEVTVNFPSDIITKLNGSVPKGISSVNFYYDGDDDIVNVVGCDVTNITSTSITLKAYLNTGKLTAWTSLNSYSATTTVSIVTGTHNGSIRISYIIIG